VGWIHEIKFDGYRTQAHLRNGRPAIYTRRAHDWTRRFQTIADALKALPAKGMILDGEAVADSRGIPDFRLLHADLAAGRMDRLLYYAFDLLYLDGLDLRGAQLAERKRLLSQLLTGASDRILYAEHLASFELDAPIRRVYSAEVPMPYAAHLEQPALPQPAVTAATARIVVRPA
jgi:bifunctional non-homologous end joining protein LigD